MRTVQVQAEEEFVMKRFAILGYPLGHTLSPKLHRLLAEQLGEQIEYSICAIPPEELEEHFEELFCMDGFNITIPHKQAIIPYLDDLDKKAAFFHKTSALYIEYSKSKTLD